MREFIEVAGLSAFATTVCYLICMARIASFLIKEAGVTGVGIDGANAQMKLIRIVFLRNGLDPLFASRHSRLLRVARYSGVVGFLLIMLMFASIMMGYTG
ncbi:hypothetical protein [Luteibacter sahnii]|uniref:hypothetical protein n=1 Tax=Luteibacter sahnii TaxID=3021977 RepID=UPI002A6AF7E0|nr:hypothetical protein [Luteibacter sp. PPL193]MDY1547662.1 hypothetical protein [Luteibacter sp. PPL193]